MTDSIIGRPGSQEEAAAGPQDAAGPQAAAGPQDAAGPVANPSPDSTRFYLRQFDLYRVIAFLGVIAQHCVLWPVPGGSAAGWSLVMVLHATRNVFFFLAALVAGYSELSHPRPFVVQWYRRIGRVLVPYLAWTLIYFVYTIARQPSGPSAALTLLWHDLLHGYYQLYFLVVLFQVFLVLPGVMWLVRRTRGHHLWVLALSVALQLAMMGISHYGGWQTGFPHGLRSFDLWLITSRLIFGYQLYVIAGAIAADHMGDLQRLVERRSARILSAALGAFCLAIGYYVVGLLQGQTPGHASDLYQPIAVVWFLAACGGLWALGWRWARRAATREHSRFDRLVTWGSDASGGFYLGHVLILQLIFSGLAMAGLTGHSTWAWSSLVLYVGTVLGTGIIVGVLLRTPLRWVLTGPVRSAEREAYPMYPPRLPSGQPRHRDVTLA